VQMLRCPILGWKSGRKIPDFGVYELIKLKLFQYVQNVKQQNNFNWSPSYVTCQEKQLLTGLFCPIGGHVFSKGKPILRNHPHLFECNNHLPCTIPQNMPKLLIHYPYIDTISPRVRVTITKSIWKLKLNWCHQNFWWKNKS
jgi:hypothetical protein